jgi:PAS domain S-box-containing protein
LTFRGPGSGVPGIPLPLEPDPLSALENDQSRALIEALPAAVYMTDAAGLITYYNEAAAKLWGYRPELGKSEFCGSWKLYWPDGTPLPHDECPMALALKQQRPIRGMEAIAERPDGSRIAFIPYPTPLFDASGRLTGAINMLVDISDRKRAEGVQAAIYHFTDRLFRVTSPPDIYNAALDAICSSLGCNSASVLLFDDAGVMRFAAWRGLSDAYRQAVEGHSPWNRDTKDPQPICIADIASADIDDGLKATVTAEGIRALAFVPLVATGKLIGKFMTYYGTPHAFSSAEVNLAITIARQLGFSIERMRAEDALRESRAQLRSELDAAHQLQIVSTQLIHENDADALYTKILDAAVTIMRSDFASMQMLYPERGSAGELRLLAFRGFNPEAAEFWEWVRADSECSCGEALRTRQRAIVPDAETCGYMVGTEDLETFRRTGIRAMQSTPLVSRTGRLLGMISTHWGKPHQPSERDLRLLDVLARQAADLVERKQTELTDQRLAAIIESSHDAIVSKDLNGVIATWNRGAEQLFGYTAAEAIGQPVTILIPPERHNEEPEILARIRRGERVDHYETVRLRKDGVPIDISLTVSPVKDVSGKVVGASKIARDITEHKQAQERQVLLAQEIHHRTKNLFAVVHAVVSRSFSGNRSVEDAKKAVLDRLHSLAQTHAMLIEKEWQGADIAEVVRTELSPYVGRATIEGPSIALSPKAAQNFALAVHELATNAAKYGALSNLAGHVHVSWSVPRPNDSRLFTFCWQERGGPEVMPPARKGFGSAVLEQVMAEYFDTPPQIEYARDGVRYELTGSLDAIAVEGEDDIGPSQR